MPAAICPSPSAIYRSPARHTTTRTINFSQHNITRVRYLVRRNCALIDLSMTMIKSRVNGIFKEIAVFAAVCLIFLLVLFLYIVKHGTL